MTGDGVSAGGVERDVTFADADPAAQGSIDAAYHAKYDRYGARIVGTGIGHDGSRGDHTIRISDQPQ